MTLGRVARVALPGALCLLLASHTTANGQAGVPPPPLPTVLFTTRPTIPAGEFWMGRTRLWLMDEIGWQIRERYDDRPVHRVRLPAFTIDSHEVTNVEYAAFASSPSSGVEPPYHWGGTRPAPGKERLPVYNVTWFDAAKYCAAQGGRLPTEAEWERAARGDVADRDYPWATTTSTKERRRSPLLGNPPRRRLGLSAMLIAALVPVPYRWARLRRTRSGCTTYRATCGSGRPTGTTSTTTVKVRSTIPPARHRGATG